MSFKDDKKTMHYQDLGGNDKEVEVDRYQALLIVSTRVGGLCDLYEVSKIDENEQDAYQRAHDIAEEAASLAREARNLVVELICQNESKDEVTVMSELLSFLQTSMEVPEDAAAES
jgi:hypothetical protein